MRLGDRPPHPLAPQQRRAIKLTVVFGIVLILGSILIRATYREMPAYVVGSEIEISSAVEGTVAEVHHQENESFKAGDKLVTLENGKLKSQLDAVQHDLEEINHSLSIEQSRDGFERRRFDLESSIANDQSDLVTSQAELQGIDQLLPGLREWRDLASERFRRGQELRDQDAITVAELDERRRTLMEADSRYQESMTKRATLDARSKRLEQVLGFERQRLGRINEERTALITDLELKRREKEGDRDELQAAISRLVLVADHDGVVSKIIRKPGEYVSSGGPVLKVMQDEQLFVEAYLRVTEKRFIKPGDAVEVLGPSGRLKGKISNVRPKLEPLPGGSSAFRRQQNYVVLVIAFDDPRLARGSLTPAQHVTARIHRRLSWPTSDQAIADDVEE
jgi:membrane fusion protein, multidrug efflux system